MSLRAASYWRRPVVFDPNARVPHCSALFQCGFQPTPEFECAVAELKKLALYVGHVRPTVGPLLGMFSAAQRSRHFGWKWLGLAELLNEQSPKLFFDRAATVRFPLDGIRPILPADLSAAMDKICELQEDQRSHAAACGLGYRGRRAPGLGSCLD